MFGLGISDQAEYQDQRISEMLGNYYVEYLKIDHHRNLINTEDRIECMHFPCVGPNRNGIRILSLNLSRIGYLQIQLSVRPGL